MSTKIYNGYRLPKMDNIKLMSFLGKVKSKIDVIHKKLWNQCVAQQATTLIDLNALGEKKQVIELLKKSDRYNSKENWTEFCPKWVAYDSIRERIKKVAETSLRDPEIDFDFHLCLIPTKTQILALLYTEQNEMTKAWESFKEVSSYYYFNNSDRPDKVSVAEWNKRKRDWDKALGADGIPGTKSLQYHPIDKFFPFPSYEDIKAYIPSLNDRAFMHAEDAAFQEFVNTSKDKEIKKKAENRQFVSLIMDFRGYRKNPEGKKLMDKHVKKIKSVLKKRLVKSDFIDEIKICKSDNSCPSIEPTAVKSVNEFASK